MSEQDTSLAVIEGKVLTEKNVMDTIDLVVQDMYATNSAKKAMGVISAMDNLGRVTGLAKAKVLWNVNFWYEETGQKEKTGDTFEDYVEGETGTLGITTKRYLSVWQAIEDCVIPKKVQSRRMDDLVKIASALSQGYEFSKDNWKQIERASNSSEVRDIINKIKGKPARKSGITGEIDRAGSIWAWQGGDRFFIGSLDVTSENPTVKKMIRRIIDNTGLQEK